MKTPVQASREAGYKDGTSFAPNARKRAQRKDIRARVAEIQAKEADLVSINAEWIRRSAAEVAGVKINDDQIKASDKIAALNLLAKMTPGALAPEKHEHTLNELGSRIDAAIQRVRTAKR